MGKNILAIVSYEWYLILYGMCWSKEYWNRSDRRKCKQNN